MCVCEAVCIGVDGAMVTSTCRWRRCARRAGWARARASFARRRMRLDARYGSAAARVSMRLRDETAMSAQAQGVPCDTTIRCRCVVEALVQMPRRRILPWSGLLAHSYARDETSTGVEALISGEPGPSST
jgi:hypothetical protein